MAHYGWSWHYLHWGIRWPIVQRMQEDAPGYESAKAGTKTGKAVPLAYDEADDLNAYVQTLERPQ